MATDPRIVISYAREDGQALAVDGIAPVLRDAGLSFTFDHFLEGGEGWKEQFRELVDRAEHLILVLSPAALASPACNWEWDYARSGRAQIHPVKATSGIADLSLPEWLKATHQYDLAIDEQRRRLLRALEGPPRIWRTRFMAPPLPDGFVERPDAIARARDELLKGGSVALTAVLRGAGGFGKTALAIRLARDPAIRDAFHDGVLWVTLGERSPDPVLKLTDLVAEVTGKASEATTLDSARTALARALDDRHCLLVLDDVWRKADLQPFLPMGERDRTVRLVTTRDRGVVENRFAEIVVDRMRGDEALRLLTRDLPAEEVTRNHAALASLAEGRLRGWALPLRLANAILREEVEFGASLAETVRHLSDRLGRHGVAVALHADQVGDARETIEGTIAASLSALSPELARRAEELGALAEDAAVTLASAARLWGVVEADARATAMTLLRRSLIERLDLTPAVQAFWLHDTMREVLGRRLGPDKLRDAHARFAAGWAAELADNWGGLRDDYALRHLPKHLAEAGQKATIESLLLDPGWIEAKIGGPGVQALLADFDAVAVDRGSAAALIGRALALAAGPLARAPRELFGQLLGRLVVEDAIGIEALRDAVTRRAGPNTILPLRPTLTPPGPEIRRIEGHRGLVTCAIALPNGRLLSAGLDSTLRLWDADSGREIRRFKGHEGWVTSVAALPDARLVSGGEDGTLRLWDAESGGEIRRFDGHRSTVLTLAALPDGRLLSGGRDGTLRLWDADSGRAIRNFEGHRGSAPSVAALPDGRLLSGGRDGTLRLWDADSGHEIRCFQGHHGVVQSVAALVDGRLLSGGTDGTLRLWDADSGREVRRFSGHRDHVTSMAALPDGRFVSGSNDSTLRLWDANSGRELRCFEGHRGRVKSVATLPAGRLLSGGADGTLRLWEADSGRATQGFRGHQGSVLSVAALPDGRVLSGGIDGTLQLWGAENGTLRLWAADIGHDTRRFPGYPDGARSVAALPDGRLLSSGTYGTLQLWDAESGREIRRFEGHKGHVLSVAALPRGRLLSGGDDGTLRLWDANSGREIRRFEGHGDWVTSVAALPDGRLVSGGEDATLRLWDAESGREIRRFDGHRGAVLALAALPDGRLLSGGRDGTLRLWDTESGPEVRSLAGHPGTVLSVEVLPDGRLLSGGADSTLRLWDAYTGREQGRLTLDAAVTAIAACIAGTVVAGDALGRLHWLRITPSGPTLR